MNAPYAAPTTLKNKRNITVKDDRLARVLNGEDFLLFDGAMGTALQARGFDTSQHPELLCLSNPAVITDIHKTYVEAGSEVATTNTFGANALKLAGAAHVLDVFAAATACARESGVRYVAADIGPLGALLEPSGTLTFEEAYQLFAEQAQAIAQTDADLVIIETMSDVLEMKAAILAVQEHTSLPIFATMTFGEHGQTFLGADPVTAAHAISSLGVQALGANCSLGPEGLAPLVAKMAAHAPCPVIVQANAGLPHIDETGANAYDIGPDEYAAAVGSMLDCGVSIVGGCCGTNPSYIARLAKLLNERKNPVTRPCATPTCNQEGAQALRAVTSGRATVELAKGAAIAPTVTEDNREEALDDIAEGFYDSLVDAALDADEEIVDVFVGFEGVDEQTALVGALASIQELCAAPLQISATTPHALEQAIRRYAGKPLVSLDAMPPAHWDEALSLVARYGCALAYPVPAEIDGKRNAAFDDFRASALAAGVNEYNLCSTSFPGRTR